MTASRIEDLLNVSVEHMVGATTGLPLVIVRAESAGTVLLGHIDPAAAREIAAHLVEAAARAEYELDLLEGAKAAGLDEQIAITMMQLVRTGEAARHTGGDS